MTSRESHLRALAEKKAGEFTEAAVERNAKYDTEEMRDNYRFGINHGYKNGATLFLDPLLVAMKNLEKLDEWQGSQMCNASVYEIEDDEFGMMQFFVHSALAEIEKLLDIPKN